MSEPIHDWWSQLTPFEKSNVRLQEREIERKEQRIAELRQKGGNVRRIAQIALLVAGHRFMRQELVNRGVQRSRHGYKPKITAKDRRITHMQVQPSAGN